MKLLLSNDFILEKYDNSRDKNSDILLFKVYETSDIEIIKLLLSFNIIYDYIPKSSTSISIIFKKLIK